MAENPITTPLPADLPEQWTYGQTVGPNGTDVGLTQQHGYNYLMKQVNAAQEGVNTLGEAFEDVAPLGEDGKVPGEYLPEMDYIPTSQKGAAGGVASLGADGKVPTGQLPVGTPNGVAGLDGTGKVPTGQLPAMNYLPTAGGTMSGAINMNGQRITNLPEPQADAEPLRKGDTYSKAQQLADETKTLYGLGTDAVPDDVFKQIAGFPDKGLKNRVMVSFYESGSFVAPNDMVDNKAIVVCVGGGGGGAMGGGGGGYITIKELALTPGNSYSIVVGAGGIGARNGGSQVATAGGTTSFGGTLVTANGGQPASAGKGGDGGAGGGSYGNSNKGGNGGTYGGGGGSADYTGGNGGTYGGGGGGNSGSSSGGNGGTYGGRGGGGGYNGRPGASFSDSISLLFPFLPDANQLTSQGGRVSSGGSGSKGGGGGGGFGGKGGEGNSNGGGGGGGYLGNGGSGPGGGGNLGGDGGDGNSYGGGGGGFFAKGGNASSTSGGSGGESPGGGGGGSGDDEYGGTGGTGGCFIFYQKKESVE